MQAVNTLNGSAVNRSAGIALMGSLILMIIATLFFPGIRVIDRVDQTDFASALAVISDHTILAQLVNVAAIGSTLLYVYAFLVLFRSAGSFAGMAGSVARYGIGLGTFTWTLFAVGLGMRHMTIHLLQRGNEDPQLAEQFTQLATSTHVVSAAIFFAWVAIFPVAIIMLGFALASRCERMDGLKAASIVMGIAGVGQLVVYVIALVSLDFDLVLMLNIFNTLLFIAAICLGVIGVQLYKGRSELTGQ